MTKLTAHSWQLRDLATLRANDYTGGTFVEAGGGKSLTATLAIVEAKPRVTLIIAPKSTHETAWVPTIRDSLAPGEKKCRGSKRRCLPVHWRTAPGS